MKKSDSKILRNSQSKASTWQIYDIIKPAVLQGGVKTIIYVTGDTHRDFTRFNTDIFPEQKEMTKNDYVIICGDFGIWDNSAEEKYWMQWLDKKTFTTLFVGGNHENYDMLRALPIEEWHGGNVQRVRSSILHLMRGQMFEIKGKRFFTMGGASSHDIQDGILEPNDPDFKKKKRKLDRLGALYRINHVSWWPDELPTDEEYTTARENLERCDWRMDYLVTHCCPTSVQDKLSNGFYRSDHLTDFFEEVRQKCSFQYWLFGHYHENRLIDNRYVLLYEQITRII